jgi:hypothetical protein
VEYAYSHGDLFGACCRLSLRTELDLFALYGPLLLGSSVEDQAFILLWGFNIIDLQNESLSVVLSLSKLEPYRLFISNALERILDMISLAFAFLGEQDTIREKFALFFQKTFNMRLPYCTEAYFVDRLGMEPGLIFSILEVIQAMLYSDHTRIKHRLDYFHGKCDSFSPVFYKCVTVLEVFNEGKALSLPFTCDQQRHLYKVVWLAMIRSSRKMVTPLQLCMDPALESGARDWLVSTILMLSPDLQVCTMIQLLQLNNHDGSNWLELFPSANGLWTFFSLLDRIHDEDMVTILDVQDTFLRIVGEFHRALQIDEVTGIQRFDDAINIKPFVKALLKWTSHHDQAFLRVVRPQIFPSERPPEKNTKETTNDH